MTLDVILQSTVVATPGVYNATVVTLAVRWTGRRLVSLNCRTNCRGENRSQLFTKTYCGGLYEYNKNQQTGRGGTPAAMILSSIFQTQVVLLSTCRHSYYGLYYRYAVTL